jgi:hypothetical protein
VPEKGDPAVVAPAARGRLAHVVKQRAEAQSLAAGELVGQRLIQNARHLGAELPEHRRRVGLDRIQLPQHLDRVAEHVEVVKGTLLDALQLGQLGEHGGKDPEPLRQLQAGERAIGHHQAAQLGEDSLGGGLGQAPGGLGGEPLGLGLGRQAKLRHEAHETQRAEGIVVVGAGRYEPQDPGAQVALPVVGVQRVASPHGDRDRVHGEVPPSQVLLDGGPLKRGHVHVEAPLAVERPPRAEGVRQGERRAVQRLGHRAGGGAGVAVHRHIEILQRSAQQRVAHHPADEPGGWAAGQGIAQLQHCLGCVQRSRGHVCSLRTRCVSPHVTS